MHGPNPEKPKRRDAARNTVTTLVGGRSGLGSALAAEGHCGLIKTAWIFTFAATACDSDTDTNLGFDFIAVFIIFLGQEVK